jgi:hypothetical protein
MKRYPSVPDVAKAPADFFANGHLWVQELVAGELLRFQVQPDGSLRFGSRRRVFDAGDVPPRFEHATRTVRADLDVDALRAAVDDVADVVCFAVATQYAGVEYDWARLPSVLGIDVWDAERESFLAVDDCERTFDRLGLEPVNALDREVHVRDFDVDDLRESMPGSAWRDGPVAGVVLRQKTGDRVAVRNPAVDPDPAGQSQPPERVRETTDPDADHLAAVTATAERFGRVAATVRERGLPVTFDTVYDRVLASIYREHHHWLTGDEAVDVDRGAFRDAVAARTSEYLDD